MTRDLRPGTQVWEKAALAPAPVWRIDAPEGDGFRCWHPDGHGGRVERVFAADELETLDERNERGRQEDEARRPKPPRKPLYDV